MDAKKYTAIYCMTCRTGCRSSEKNFCRWRYSFWATEKTLRLRIKTLPVLLMSLPMESRAKVETGLVQAQYSHSLPERTQSAISAWRRKITRASFRRRAGTVVPKAEKFWWFINFGSQKFSVKKSESRNNHRYAEHSGLQSYPCKNTKLLRRPRRA